MKIANRIRSMPPYLFADLDKKLAAKRAEGVDVISLGIGSPDLPTPDHIVEAMREAVGDPATHRYPSFTGSPDFRGAVARYYEHRFSVELDPDREILALIGSKEGTGHLAFAFVDPGDEALIPDPGYPVYAGSTRLAGGMPVSVPALADGSLTGLASVSVPERARLMWLNFPGNPTGTVAEPGVFERAVEFAREHDLLLVHDAAYADITFDGYVAPSVLEAPGAKDVAIEFGTLSKHYNMAGWRIGWVAGSAEAIRALGVVKTNLDTGQFTAIQRAAVAALDGPQDHLPVLRDTYQRRRDLVVDALNGLGWSMRPPLGSIYVWAPTPEGRSSVEFADLLLNEAGVFVAPGTGYGPGGEGYVRFSLTVADERLAEAMERIAKALG